MNIKEYYTLAIENECVDVYALIMFLVYEKKVLSFDDTKEKLEYYLQDKFKSKINKHIKEYMEKMNIKYKPNVYEIQIEPKAFKTVYILASNEKQAKSFCFSQMFNPIDISVCDKDRIMTKFNKKDEPINITIKQLRDQEKKIPSFLGGF